MSSKQLVEVAQAMVAEGQGILAIDESSGTIAKRFLEDHAPLPGGGAKDGAFDGADT